MADPIPPGPPNGNWPAWLWFIYLAALGWFGDWLRSRWQNRKPPPPSDHPHRRHDDYCDECHPEPHHHHRTSDEDEEG